MIYQVRADNLFKQYVSLSVQIKKLLKLSAYFEWHYFDSDKVAIDRKRADDRFLLDRLALVSEKLSDALFEIEYLSKPVIGEFTLGLDITGHYAVPAHQYNCGYRIEYLAPNPEYDPDDLEWEPLQYMWKISRIEHDGTRYYIVGDKDIQLDGLHVRVRAT